MRSKLSGKPKSGGKHSVKQKITQIYIGGSDSMYGLHSRLEDQFWLLVRWGFTANLHAVEKKLAQTTRKNELQWVMGAKGCSAWPSVWELIASFQESVWLRGQLVPEAKLNWVGKLDSGFLRLLRVTNSDTKLIHYHSDASTCVWFCII